MTPCRCCDVRPAERGKPYCLGCREQIAESYRPRAEALQAQVEAEVRIRFLRWYWSLEAQQQREEEAFWQEAASHFKWFVSRTGSVHVPNGFPKDYRSAKEIFMDDRFLERILAAGGKAPACPLAAA